MTAVVVGPGADAVAAEAQAGRCRARTIFVQAERRGTAHAVLAASDALARGADDVLDHLRRHAADPAADADAGCARRWPHGAAIAVLGFRPADPTGYGRLVLEGGELVAIREELDASAGGTRASICAMAA